MTSLWVPEKWQIPLVTTFAVVILLVPPAILFLFPAPPGGPPSSFLPGVGEQLQELMTPHLAVAFLALALFCIIYGIPVLVAPVYLLYHRRPARPVPDRPPWGITDLLAVFVLVITVGFGASLLLDVRGQLDGAAFLGDSIVKGLAILILFAWLHHFRGAGAADIGLHRKGILSSIPWGGYLYVSAFPLFLGSAYVSLATHAAAGAIPESHPVNSVLLGEGSTPGVWVAVLLVAVGMAPLFEEIFFRGFLYTTLRAYLGPGLAMLSSAAIFAALHPISGFYTILLLGVIFAFVYEKTGSLFAPMVLHMVHNGCVLTLLLLVGSDPSAPLPW